MKEILNNKIMIIEDSEFARAMIMVKLKNSGFHNLDLPDSSIEAWKRIADAQVNDNPYDLIITDLNMPGLDGIELISKIKEDAMSEKLKLIVISADADRAIINICKSLGVLAYFSKPFVGEELVAVVRAIFLDQEIPEIKGMFQVPEVS